MKRRAIAICLSLILTVTGIVAALPVMVNFAYADEPSSTMIGTNEIKDELIENYPGYYDAITDFFTQYIDLLWDRSDYWTCALNEGNAWLITLYYNNNNGNDWYSYSYTQYNNTRSGLSRQENAGSNAYNGVTVSQYLYARNGTVSSGSVVGNQALQFTSAHNLGSNLSGGWLCACPTTYNFNVSGRKCYISVPVAAGNGGWSMEANLIHGTSFNPSEFHWFKFQLGQRWYITTYNQDFVNMMVEEEDSFWAWHFDVRDDLDILTDRIVVWPDQMQRLPGAENFISQNLINISSSGVFAYDITDFILNDSTASDGGLLYHHLDSAEFYSYSGTEYDWFTTLVAYSDDVVDLVLTPQEENQTQNNAWTTINNYTINYPSVTVSPQQLADQLFGDTAYTGFMGDIRIPYSLGIKFSLFGQDVNLCDAYFHYWLYQLGGGLGADEDSLLNFDLFNACVIAAPQVNRNVYVSYWSSTDSSVIDFDYIGLMDTQDLLDSFDLLLVAPAGSEWLKEVDSSILPFSGSSAAYTNLNQESVTTPRGAEGIYPVYIIVSQKAITKSQLYVFCDSQSKLYKLLSDYINKRDLWDTSFFQWSMSIFWELETINGHLNSIETILGNWTFKEWFEDLSTKLGQIADNTSETQDPMWYESLWNWVRKFTPSDNAFTNGLNAIETGLDNIPEIALPTQYPDYPLLPTFTPTPVPIEGS